MPPPSEETSLEDSIAKFEGGSPEGALEPPSEYLRGAMHAPGGIGAPSRLRCFRGCRVALFSLLMLFRGPRLSNGEIRSHQMHSARG